MKRLISALLLLLSVFSPTAATAAAPDVETIIARHLLARGGEPSLRAIKTLMFEKGQYSEPGYVGAGNAAMMLMRPYYKLVGDPRQKNDIMEGYNGAAWEYYADPGVVLWTTGPANAATRHFAGVDGPLLDYKARGFIVELAGDAMIDRRATWNVRVTMPDGYQTDNFIDKKTYLIIASAHTAKVHAFGTEVTSQTRFSDFRRVAGVLFPFRSSEVDIATGKELNAMQWGTITANAAIPVSWFSPPAFERTPIQTFIEQLYIQREDPSAVMWTYRLFRRANPSADTSDAAQLAGYQMLKMGQIATAVTLLEQNAKDYAAKADAAFGLGRAYAGAERMTAAREQFQRALKLNPKHKRAAAALADLDAATVKPQ